MVNIRPYTFPVEGRPVPKERPRMRGRKAYTPQRTLDAEQLIVDAYSGPTFEGPVAVEVFYTPTGQSITIRPLKDTPKPKLRGDVDNYLKTTLDALQKCAFEDDAWVLYVEATKS